MFKWNYSFQQPYWLTQSSKRIYGIFPPFMTYFHNKNNWALIYHFPMAKRNVMKKTYESFSEKINSFHPLFFVISITWMKRSNEVSTKDKFSWLVERRNTLWFSWRLMKIIYLSLVQRPNPLFGRRKSGNNPPIYIWRKNDT